MRTTLATRPLPAPAPLRVLIAEDSEDDWLLMLAELRHSGLQPRSKRVDNGPALRAALAEEPWDIVLSDYSMPQFTALDALAIVRESDPDLPFIIVSGSIGETAAAEAMRAGAHDFFLKDKLTRLASAVQRELREAALRRERRAALRDLQESQERLRQAVRARDEFLSIASHELRTPLTALTLNVQTAQGALQKTDVSEGSLEKLRTKLDAVASSVLRLRRLVDDLLVVTEIDSAGTALTLESLDLEELVRTVVAANQERARTAGSEIRVTTRSVRGRWDRLALESVLLNLLSNAIKYGQSKPIDVELDRVGDEARLVVTDRGIGIAPSDQERIFHRFERAVPTEHYGGFGLGLWITRRIILGHGGRISLASKPGCGATFTVALPLEPPPERSCQRAPDAR